MGFWKKVYEHAMVLEREKEGIPVVSQAPIRVSYDGKVIGEYFADLLVDGKVIVEIKASNGLAPGTRGPTLELPQSNED